MKPTHKPLADKGIIAVARIGRAHGVRGELKVWPFAPDVDTLEKVREVLLPGERDGQWIARRVVKCRRGSRCFILALEGVVGRTAAEALNGTNLYVRTQDLPPPEDDAFYYFDLLGMSVWVGDEEIGRVLHIEDNGAQDILTIGDEHSEVLLPFVDDFVEVDLEARRIVATPPPGLLEVTRVTFENGRREKRDTT